MNEIELSTFYEEVGGIVLSTNDSTHIGSWIESLVIVGSV